MVQNTPFFSVIIPTRNRSALLRKSIQSVFDQIFEDFELVVIDDGSEDDTEQLVLDIADNRIKYYKQDHRERSVARNLGIEKALGKYICFLDDDDTYHENHLQLFHDFYKKLDNPMTILRSGYCRSNKKGIQKTTNYTESKHKNVVRFAAFNMCGVWSLSIPRAFLIKDTFPEKFPHWQDTHLILRLFMKYGMIQLNQYTYQYNIHSEMGSKKATIDFDPISRADINVKAIEDLFETEKDKIFDFVPKNTLRFLKAEKYIQYFLNSGNSIGSRRKLLLKKSLSNGIYFRLWKYYLQLIF